MAATYLSRLLKANGLSQSQVARAIGIYQPRISLFCSGHERPSEREAEKLSNFFGLPANVILGIEELKDTLSTYMPGRLLSQYSF